MCQLILTISFCIIDYLVTKDISNVLRSKSLCSSVCFLNAGNRTNNFTKNVENCRIKRFHSRMFILALNVYTDSTKIFIIRDELSRR